MALIDHMICGRMILFNSVLFSNRKAFSIDLNNYDQVVYRGWFGLKCLDRETFMKFAQVIDVYDYLDRPLISGERWALKRAFMDLQKDIRKYKCVEDFVDALFKKAGIRPFINPEGSNGKTTL